MGLESTNMGISFENVLLEITDFSLEHAMMKIEDDVRQCIEDGKNIIHSPFIDNEYKDTSYPTTLDNISVIGLRQNIVRKNWEESIKAVLNNTYAYIDALDALKKFYYLALCVAFYERSKEYDSMDYKSRTLRLLLHNMLYKAIALSYDYDIENGIYDGLKNYADNCVRNGVEDAFNDIYCTVYDGILSPLWYYGSNAWPEIADDEIVPPCAV